MSVKNKVLLVVVLMSILTMLTGCAPKPLSEPLALTAFTWQHRGSYTGLIYSYTAERTEAGDRLLLSLNAGSRELDILVEEDVMGQLGAIAAEHRLDRWDGFDKNDRRAMDGTGFTLTMTTAEGETIEARGSNAFPKGYTEAKAAIEGVFEGFIVSEGS